MSWLNIIKQAVDSVESQLDSILDESKQKTAKKTENQSLQQNQKSAAVAKETNKIASQSKSKFPLDFIERMQIPDLISLETPSLVANKSDIEYSAPKTEGWDNDDILDFSDSIAQPNPAKHSPTAVGMTSNETIDLLKLEQASPYINEVAPNTVAELEVETLIDQTDDIASTQNSNKNNQSIPTAQQISLLSPEDPGISQDSKTREELQSESKRLDKLKTDTVTTETSTSKQPSPLSPAVGDLEQILTRRENQLMDAKVENSRLYDNIENLNSQISSLENELTTIKQTSSKNIELLQTQCAELEKKLGQAARTAQESGSSMEENEGRLEALKRALDEKQSSIQGLLQEGEQLAKDILRANNSIKKLRKEKAEIQNTLEEKERRCQSLEETVEGLKKTIQNMNEKEKSNQTEIKKLSNENTDLMNKISDIEVKYVKISQELNDFKSKLQTKTSELVAIQEKSEIDKIQLKQKAIEEQIQANNILKEQLQTATEIANTLQSDVEQLTQDKLQSDLLFQKELASREASYESRVKDLEKRLADLEIRNSELQSNAQAISDPIILQLAQLESQFQLARTDWESLETELIKRTQAAELESGENLLKLRELQKEFGAIKVNNGVLEQKNIELQKELDKLQLNSALDKDTQSKNTMKELEVIKMMLKEKHTEHDQEILLLNEEHRKTMMDLKQNYESRIEKLLRNQIRLESQQSEAVSPTSPRSSISSPVPVHTQIKTLKSQINSLETQLKSLETTRDQLQSDYIASELRKEELENELQEQSGLKTKYDDLNLKYSTVLELLGEREETILELRADIQDMKMVFRAQLSEQFQ